MKVCYFFPFRKLAVYALGYVTGPLGIIALHERKLVYRELSCRLRAAATIPRIHLALLMSLVWCEELWWDVPASFGIGSLLIAGVTAGQLLFAFSLPFCGTGVGTIPRFLFHIPRFQSASIPSSTLHLGS